MTDKQLRKMILAIITAADYDLAKSFGRGSEDPQGSKRTMQTMISIARKHVEAVASTARAEGAREERETVLDAADTIFDELEGRIDGYEVPFDAAHACLRALRSRAAAGGGNATKESER